MTASDWNLDVAKLDSIRQRKRSMCGHSEPVPVYVIRTDSEESE